MLCSYNAMNAGGARPSNMNTVSRPSRQLPTKSISKAHVFRESGNGAQHEGLRSLGERLEREGLILRAREGNRSLQDRLRRKCLGSG